MSPNKNFTLDVDDLDIIETALQKELGRLTEARITHIESTITPAEELASVKDIDIKIKEIYTLLGKLHNQKVWYRPKNKTYVGG